MKISERGQVTVPKEIREKLGLHRNVEVEFIASGEGVLLRKKQADHHALTEMFGVLARPSSTDEYIEKIRGR